MKKMSRMEANKDVRRILHRHGVDLCTAQYSVAGRDIRLTGYLAKTDGSKFNASQIESLIQEFQRYLPGYSVSGSFDNWSFSTDHITFTGDKNSGNGTSASEENAGFVFDPDDYESEAS